MTGSKILRILKVAGLAPELPEDLYHLIKKVITTTPTRMHVHSQLLSMVSTAPTCWSDLGQGNTVAHSQRRARHLSAWTSSGRERRLLAEPQPPSVPPAPTRCIA